MGYTFFVVFAKHPHNRVWRLLWASPREFEVPPPGAQVQRTTVVGDEAAPDGAAFVASANVRHMAWLGRKLVGSRSVAGWKKKKWYRMCSKRWCLDAGQFIKSGTVRLYVSTSSPVFPPVTILAQTWLPGWIDMRRRGILATISGGAKGVRSRPARAQRARILTASNGARAPAMRRARGSS